MSQKKRTYETICITKVDMPEDKFTALVDRCKAAVTTEGQGEWLYTDDWGRSKIAYTIGKDNRGRWTYFRYKALPAASSEIRRTLGLNEFVLRQITTRADEDGADYNSLRQNMPQDMLDREKSRDAWREERFSRRGSYSAPRGESHALANTAIPGSDMSDDDENSDDGAAV